MIRTRSIRPRSEAGSASIWLLGCAVLLLVVAAFAAGRGAAVLARHRAESAADLAALAAGGQIGVDARYCRAAAEIAARNGAALAGCRPDIAADGRAP
jgi:secretion/DNA translocation related TadE-like protein